MKRINPTYQKFLFLLVKLSIVFGSTYFIYDKIKNQQDFISRIYLLKEIVIEQYKLFCVVFLLSVLNWFFEILKWKTLVKSVSTISIKEAFVQSLSAHTSALITPNRIGEYGIKVLYFTKNLRKKILLLNFINHFLQMSVTVLFGFIGLLYLFNMYNISFPVFRFRKIAFIFSLLLLVVLGGKKSIPKKIRGFYWNKILLFIKQMDTFILIKSFLLSCFRYFIFSTQFYLLLVMFEGDLDYFQIVPLLYSVYLLASIIPSFPVFDWAIKGSVSIYILNFAGINDVSIILATLIMWLLNFALPALIGSYYVLVLQPKKM